MRLFFVLLIPLSSILMSTISNGFWFKIMNGYNPTKKRVIDGADYYILPHRAEYKIKLGNDTSTRVDARVYVDGQKIGTWRIKPFSSTLIERTTYSKRKLTFLEQTSYQAESAGIIPGEDNNGLIKVVFRPEKKENTLMYRQNCCNNIPHVNLKSSNCFNLDYGLDSYGSDNYGEGATALGNRSFQEFEKTTPITNIDYSRIITLYARLLVKKEKEFVSIKKNSNKYPKRINNTNAMYDYTYNHMYDPIYDNTWKSWKNLDNSFERYNTPYF